jgi:hypothetical protein
MEQPIEKSTNKARQGVTGHNVRYVLAISLGAAVVILAILWFAFFMRQAVRGGKLHGKH